MQNQLPMQDQFVDFFRNGMRTAAGIAQASLQTSVRLQEKQLEMVRGIIEENSRSAERLSQARSIEELTALQSQLAGAQIQRLAGFWSTLWQAAAENQREVMGQMSEQMSSQAGKAIELASRGAGSMREGQPHHGKHEQRKTA